MRSRADSPASPVIAARAMLSGSSRSAVHARGLYTGLVASAQSAEVVRTPPCPQRKKLVVRSGVPLGTPIRRQALRRLKERRAASLELLWDTQADPVAADVMVDREAAAKIRHDAERGGSRPCGPASASPFRVGVGSANRENERPLISQFASTEGDMCFADAERSTDDSLAAPDDVLKRQWCPDEAERDQGAAAAKHRMFLFRRYHGLFRQEEEVECR
jgi:hypothetical protein